MVQPLACPLTLMLRRPPALALPQVLLAPSPFTTRSVLMSPASRQDLPSSAAVADPAAAALPVSAPAAAASSPRSGPVAAQTVNTANTAEAAAPTEATLQQEVPAPGLQPAGRPSLSSIPPQTTSHGRHVSMLTSPMRLGPHRQPSQQQAARRGGASSPGRQASQQNGADGAGAGPGAGGLQPSLASIPPEVMRGGRHVGLLSAPWTGSGRRAGAASSNAGGAAAPPRVARHGGTGEGEEGGEQSELQKGGAEQQEEVAAAPPGASVAGATAGEGADGMQALAPAGRPVLHARACRRRQVHGQCAALGWCSALLFLITPPHTPSPTAEGLPLGTADVKNTWAGILPGVGGPGAAAGAGALRPRNPRLISLMAAGSAAYSQDPDFLLRLDGSSGGGGGFTGHGGGWGGGGGGQGSGSWGNGEEGEEPWWAERWGAALLALAAGAGVVAVKRGADWRKRDWRAGRL